MRKRYRVLLLAAIVAALVVRVGFALSLESSSATHVTRAAVKTTTVAANVATTAAAVASPVVVPGTAKVDDDPSSFAHPVPDAAKLLLVGTMLFGLAAAVRKAI